MNARLWRIGLALGAALAAAAALGAARPQGPLSWAGAYVDEFENVLVGGETYDAQNIMEIVQLSPTTAYLSLSLEFYNGHQCALSGVAEVEGQSLVYRGVEADAEGRRCVLALRKVGKRLVLSDETGACTNLTCGARGGYDGVDFAAKDRRPIADLPELLASSEYAAAVAEHAKAH